jgi:hypothetical protein
MTLNRTRRAMARALLLAAGCALSLASPAVAPSWGAGYQTNYFPGGTYHPGGNRGPYGLPLVDTVAGAYTYPTAQPFRGSTYGYGNYQPYYPSQHTQYSGSFRGTTLQGSYGGSGAYRAVNY